MKAALSHLGQPWRLLQGAGREASRHLWVAVERGGKPLGRISSATGLVRWGNRPDVEFPYPVDGVDGAEAVFIATRSGPRLLVREGMTGELWAGSSLLPLDDLEPWGLVRGRGRRRGVDLTPEMAGRVEYRGFALAFEFGPAPAVEARPRPEPVPARFQRRLLDREDSPFAVLACAVYAVLLTGTVFIATRQLPREVPMASVAHRFAKLIYQAPQAQSRARKEILKKMEADAKKVAAAEAPKTEAEKPAPEPKREAPKAEPDLPAKQATSPEKARAGEPGAGMTVDRTEEIRKNVSGKGLLGLLGGRGGVSVARSRGSLVEGGGPGADIDQVLRSVDGLRRAPDGGGGGLGVGGGRGVSRGIDEQARQVAAASRAAQLQERKDQAVQAKESNEPQDTFSLKEATAAINRAVASYTGGLRYLYNKELRKNPDLEGKMTVAITIAPNGTVAEARLVDTSLNAPDMERAVLERIRKWTFPPVAPRPITVTYPFVFFPTM